MAEPVQRRFSPLVLVNAPQEIDTEANQLISQLNQQKFVYRKNDELGSSSTTFLRFMTIERFILEYADTKHAQTSLSCKKLWDRFHVTDPAAFITKAYQHVNTEIAHKILNGIMNDGLTTFDHPVAVVNVMGEDAEANGLLKDRVGDLPVRPSIELDVSIGTDFADMSAESWTVFMNKTLSDDLLPYSGQLLSEATNKSQSKTMQSTFGFATKFFAMSKKYLTQTNSSLTGLKHSEETVVTAASAEVIASTSSLRESEFQLRRAADLSFMFQQYRQAGTFYDALRKDAQTRKNWPATASAHQWSLISKLLAGVTSSLPGQDLDQIIQQCLLNFETHFSAAHLVTVLSILAVPIQVLFPLLSRIIQSGIEPMWKLVPLVLQMHTAVVIKKNRMALLLLDIFSTCCEQLGSYPTALMALRVAHPIIAPCMQTYFFPLYKRLLNLSLHLNISVDRNIAKVLLSNSNKLDEKEAVECWKSAADNRIVEGMIKIMSVIIDRNPNSKLDLQDFETVKGFTEMLWNSENITVDPLSLLLQTQEMAMAVGQSVQVEVLMANIYPFQIMISRSELEFEKTLSSAAVTSTDKQVRLSANSVQSLSFTVKCDHPGTIRLAAVRVTTEHNLIFRIPLNSKGFRLNFTKAQRITPTYSEFHGNYIHCLPIGKFVDAEFKFLGDSTGLVALHQECIFELKVYCEQERTLNIAVLSQNLAPLDHVLDRIGDIAVLKDLYLEAGKARKILFRSLIDATGPIDFVLAIYSPDENFMQPILRRVKVESAPLATLSGIQYQGFNQTAEKLISVLLTNKSRETLKVFETSLNIANSNVGARGISGFDLRPETPFTLTFPMSKFTPVDATLTLRLQDGRILNIPISLIPPAGPIVIYKKSGAHHLASGYSAQPMIAKIRNVPVFTLEGSDSIVLGEICKQQRDPSQDITIKAVMLSAIISPE